MAIMINGKQDLSPGITLEECGKIHLGHGRDDGLLHCARRHREEGKFVSFDDYQEFLNVTYHPRSLNYKHLRMGQAFCNEFNIHDNGLFYERLPIVASHGIWTYYILGSYYTPDYDENGHIL